MLAQACVCVYSLIVFHLAVSFFARTALAKKNVCAAIYNTHLIKLFQSATTTTTKSTATVYKQHIFESETNLK